jgi:hypothetical protein
MQFSLVCDFRRFDFLPETLSDELSAAPTAAFQTARHAATCGAPSSRQLGARLFLLCRCIRSAAELPLRLKLRKNKNTSTLCRGVR